MKFEYFIEPITYYRIFRVEAEGASRSQMVIGVYPDEAIAEMQLELMRKHKKIYHFGSVGHKGKPQCQTESTSNLK